MSTLSLSTLRRYAIAGTMVVSLLSLNLGLGALPVKAADGDTHTITANADSNGSISPSGAVPVVEPADQSFTITPNSGYHVADVLVGGSSVGTVTSYDFSDVTADHTIDASFAADAPTSSATTGNASDVTSSSATLNGTNGAVAADASMSEAFWYGPTTAGPFTSGASVGGQVPADWTTAYAHTSDTSAGGNFSFAAAGLTPATTYYFVAWTEVGGTWYPGSVEQFTTNSSTPTNPCTTVGTPFLTVTQPIVEPDSAVSSGNWAMDTFTENAVVWLGTDGTTFCAQGTVADGGTFTTNGSGSPQNDVSLESGVIGTITGGETWVFPAGTATTISDSSVILPEDNSPTVGSQFNAWQSQVLTATARASTYSFTYVADGDPSDTWTNADSGNTGDIINPSLSTVYVGPSGSDTNIGTQASPFATIQAGVTAAPAGGTVIVAAGTYAGGITIDKALTIQGANATTSANDGTTLATRGAESIIDSGSPAFTVTSNDPVAVSGFTFDDTGSPISSPNGNPSQITFKDNVVENTTGYMYFANIASLDFEDNYLTNLETATTDPSSEGLFLAGDWNGTSGTVATFTHNVWENLGNTGMNLSNVSGSITDNRFENVPYYGILVANNSSSLTISGNTFDHITSPDLSVSTYGAGVRFYTPSLTGTVSVTGNTFSNSYIGVGVRAPADLTGMDIKVNGNGFSGNTYGIKNDATGGTLDATGNWWGSVSGPTIASNPGGTGDVILENPGLVDYGSFCTNSGCVVDTTAPVITLNGDAHMDLELGATFTDPGATAVDNVDGSVAVTASGTVDISNVGDYIITYTATDAAGNVATATRIVTVSHTLHTIGGGSGGGTTVTTGSIGSTGGQVLGASTFNFTTDLTVGSTGTDVTELQNILIADGYLDIPAPTGYFGPLTEAAVKLYQAAHGIPDTGYVGPLTRAALNVGTIQLSDAQKAAILAELAQLLAQLNTIQQELNSIK